MIKQVLQSVKSLPLTRIRQASLETRTTSPQKWDLFAAVVLERMPVVSKSLTPFETEYQTMLQEIEFENSLKSDHELQHEKDLLHREMLKKGDIDVDMDMDSVTKLTAQDKKDAYTEEFTKFKFAPRITKDDQTKNLKSVNRQLEDILYLIVEQKLGDNKHFLLPQRRHKAGETLRETAERAIRETCGGDLQVQFYGNAPCGFYKYKYPKTSQADAVGAKIFFFRSAYQTGKLEDSSFMWLDKEALDTKVHKSYLSAVKQFLL